MQLQTDQKPHTASETRELLRHFQGEGETARQMALLRTAGTKLPERRPEERRQPERRRG